MCILGCMADSHVRSFCELRCKVLVLVISISVVKSPSSSHQPEARGQFLFLNQEQDVFNTILTHPWVLFALSSRSSAAVLSYGLSRNVCIPSHS